MPDVDLKYAFGLKPEKAIEYFESKGFRITWDWHEMLEDAHARAFTVAKVMRTDILQDIHGELRKAMDEGLTFADWKKNLTPRLKAKGWWGEVVNEATGEVANVGPHRLRTIFETNIQTSYMVGHYQRMMESTESRPWWMYVAVMDKLTRPAHSALNGLAFRFDDPFWNSHFPPNGFRCRCSVRALDESGLEEKVKAGEAAKRSTSGSGADANLGEVEKPLTRDGSRMYQATTVKTKDLNGRPVAMAPDAGWSYNPGKAGAGRIAVDKLADWTAPLGAMTFRDLGPLAAREVKSGYATWIAEVRKSKVTRHSFTTLGAMAPEEIQFLESKGVMPSTAAIIIEDRLVVGKKAERHKKSGDALSDAEWDSLPNAVLTPQAVLYDNDDGKLLYVMPSLDDPRKVKVVVEPDVWEKKVKMQTNAVRSVFKVGKEALLDKRKYSQVRGKIE